MIEKGRKRLFILSLAVFFLFSLLLVQFFHIQILEGVKWSKIADRQHFFEVKEPAARGAFYANHAVKKIGEEKNQKFVVDIEKYHLHIDPNSIPEAKKKAIADQLIAILDVPARQKSSFKKQFYKKSRNRKLQMWLKFDTKERILKWWGPFAKENKIARNALYFVSDYQRSYPFGPLLGQVLHTVQNVKDENEQAVPTGGLELYLNSYLQGKPGKKKLMRSPRHAMEIDDVSVYPQNGADVYLTVNHVLQAIAEEELAKGVKQFKAKGGWVVMMQPFTGEIYVLAQYPFFDPSYYQKYFNDPLLIEHTKVKAATDANEPGSVMKAVTVALALVANDELQDRGEAPLFDPEEKMATANGVFPGRSKPITDTRLYSFLNMEMAIQKSSNIYVSRLVEKIIARLGPNWYRKKLQTIFGFGLKTGIELPAESAGFLPSLGKTYSNGAMEWSLATPFSMAFGHNLLANSLQLLRSYAVIVNGGFLVKPTLVKKIVRKGEEKDEILLSHENRKNFPRVLSEKISKRVMRSLKFPTKTGGTARKADISGFTQGGKTSTAKKIIHGIYSETCYVASFMGFAPATNPEFLMIVSLDEPEYGYIPGVGKNHNGGTCAAPIFREIAKRSLDYLGVIPDDPYGYPVGDPRAMKEKADWWDETRKLQEKYEKWNNNSKTKALVK
ncbi:putative penicillin-binding protein 2 (transglycosylase/transpeptidase) [Chlamydiales bacterium STE3]|nr:putative penicillin-binding protein 2 (transglycosylase/transpeptidase) [Chlamydiales bacterium STE3]